jgi:6-phosphogluconolactonase
MGEDGHTASLFPGSELLEIKDRICAVATHPLTGQKRVTITLPVINHARKITFVVTGESKRKVVLEIFNHVTGFDKYPAALVTPVTGEIAWLLDETVLSAGQYI